MAWNWEVFLKSWLFIFLGFLLGIVSTAIYLALAQDVDLSQFDGLQILTAVLIVITIWYAYSTHKMLEEQRKTKEIAEIEKQLEKLYYPLMDILRNPRVMHYTGDEKGYYIDLKQIDEIVPFQHLASDDLKDLLERFIRLALAGRSVDLDYVVDGINFDIIDESFRELVEADIERLKEELQLIKNS